MIRHVIQIDGKQATYWERNPEAVQTVVLLHGFRGNHRGLIDFAQYLPEYRLILPDFPGYGESEPLESPHTVVNYAKWLDHFIAALEISQWTSWSHSLGGLPALIQAASGTHKPELFISVSLAAVPRNIATKMSTLYYQTSLHLPDPWRKKWVASRMVDRATGRWLFQTVSTTRRKELQRRGDQNLAELNPQVVAEQYLSSLDLDLAAYAKRVRMPALLIAGRKDIIVPEARLEELAHSMPNGLLEVMLDQGHLAPLERPAATATITRRFIESATPAQIRST